MTALWIFVFLNMIFRDLHQLGHPGFTEEMTNGIVNGVQLTDVLMLIGGIMDAVPLLMIPLTQFKRNMVSRSTNLCIGMLQIVITIGVNNAPDLDDVFFAVIEIAALLLILQQAWVWTDRAEGIGSGVKCQ